MTKSLAQELDYTIFGTEAGWVGILGSAAGLLRVTLPQPSPQEVKEQLGASLNEASDSPHLFNDLMERLKAYFAGRKVTFPDRLDLSQTTDFERKVWEAARLIAYGETRSYGWLAKQIGKPGAARAVGQALGRNPFPIIVPCHRVLASDGKLGGFSGGLEMKRYLLRLEGAAGIRQNMHR